MTVAETIKKITREHLLKNKGLVLGQCLTAVGWVGGTVPELREENGLVELSMADVSSGGIAVGVALAGRRPIYIVRYQGFQWYNAPSIVNYAAKSKEMWGIPCPIFVRSIAMDGGIGPVASGSHHSIFTRMPGIPVVAPMTPGEYQSVWNYFMTHDDPIYVSEHRRSFSVDYEMKDKIHRNADITLLPISSTRLNALEAIGLLEREGIKCNLVHLLWLKPFKVSEKIIQVVTTSKYGAVVIDGDFENGVAKSIAFDIMKRIQTRIFPKGKQKINSHNFVHALGLEDKTAGFAPDKDNLPPTPSRIYGFIKRICNKQI